MIVQCGAKRSGNFLLWRTIHLLLGRETSYAAFYAASNRLVEPIGFTHELPHTVPCGIYVVRDGRDAVASLLHFVVTPEYRARHVDCLRTDARELLALPGFLERRIQHWREHVRSYLADRRPWHLVRYEELAGECKAEVVRALADHLALELTSAKLRSILEATTVEACRSAAPGHVHSGKSGGHGELLGEEQLARFDELAGEELAAMGYVRAAASSSSS